jgi:hypothetical protein
MFGHEGDLRPSDGNNHFCIIVGGFSHAPPGPGKGVAHESQVRAHFRKVCESILIREFDKGIWVV